MPVKDQIVSFVTRVADLDMYLGTFWEKATSLCFSTPVLSGNSQDGKLPFVPLSVSGMHVLPGLCPPLARCWWSTVALSTALCLSPALFKRLWTGSALFSLCCCCFVSWSFGAYPVIKVSDSLYVFTPLFCGAFVLCRGWECACWHAASQVLLLAQVCFAGHWWQGCVTLWRL